MARTRKQRIRDGWIGVGAIGGAGLVLSALGIETWGGILIITAIFTGVGVLAFALGSGTGDIQEAAEEVEARAAERDRARDKLAAAEQAAGKATDEKAQAWAEADLLWKYLRAWQKSNVPVPNAVVEGWRARPVDIEDGDFMVLAKERDLKRSMMARDPDKWGKSFSKDIRKTEESVEKWRKGVEEIQAGKRTGPEHFDPDDYLRRLNEAFPKVGPNQ